MVCTTNVWVDSSENKNYERTACDAKPAAVCESPARKCTLIPRATKNLTTSCLPKHKNEKEMQPVSV